MMTVHRHENALFFRRIGCFQEMLSAALVFLLVLGIVCRLAVAEEQALSSIGSSSSASSSKQMAIKGLDLQSQDFNKLPTYVKADSLLVKNDERTFVYSGGVEVKQGDMTLTANIVNGKYNEHNQIEGLIAEGNVVIVKGDNIRASGEKAIFESETQTVTLTENPELQQNESVLTADSVKVYLKENRSVAEGAVRVKLVKKEEKENKSALSLIKRNK